MNKFLQTEERVKKLLTQREDFGPLVVGVDFDFTLYDPDTDTLHEDLVVILKEAVSLGFILCLWTANRQRLPWIIEKCEHSGLFFEYINISPISLGEDTIKPHFNILLDDIAGLGQAVDILVHTMKHIKEQS